MESDGARLRLLFLLLSAAHHVLLAPPGSPQTERRRAAHTALRRQGRLGRRARQRRTSPAPIIPRGLNRDPAPRSPSQAPLRARAPPRARRPRLEEPLPAPSRDRCTSPRASPPQTPCERSPRRSPSRSSDISRSVTSPPAPACPRNGTRARR